MVDIARSGWARGAVSGIGLMLVGAGLAEAVSIRTPTRSAPSEPGGRPIVTLPRPCICLVTDRSRLPPPSPDTVADLPALGPLAERLTLAGQAGVDLLQIREPDLSAAELGALVREVRTRLADDGGGRGRPHRRQRAGRRRARRGGGRRAPQVGFDSDGAGAPSRASRVPGGPFRALRRRSAGRRRGRGRLRDLRHRLPVRLEAARPPDRRPRRAGGRHPGRSGARPGHRVISLDTVAAAAEAGAAGVAAIGLFFDAAGPMEYLRGRLTQTVAGLRLAFDRPEPGIPDPWP